jgi:4-hydroxyphenylpyruvate dioxygenase
VRFANNEPLRPRFNASQIQLFVDDHGGNGVQHAAWLVDDIQSAVTGLRERGAPFLPTPDAYYRYMPERLEKCGIGRIDESIEDLRRLQILVDGSSHHKYMLQIFMKDMATIAGSRDAGPFFYEIVQRKGDRGFGAGNFRALFESIEREQHTQGRA